MPSHKRPHLPFFLDEKFESVELTARHELFNSIEFAVQSQWNWASKSMGLSVKVNGFEIRFTGY